MKFGETPSGIKEKQQFNADNISSGFDHNQEKKGEKIYLKEILDNIQNPEAKELLLDSSECGNIQAVLYGIKPMCFLNNEKDGELLEKFVISNTDVVVRGGVLLNKHLVNETVRNNPGYFREDSSLSAEEVVNKYISYQNDASATPDKVPNVQIGLLLGYPKKACEDYHRMRGAKSLFEIELNGLITRDSQDWQLLLQLQQKEYKYANAVWKDNGEHLMHPTEIYEQARYLFYKYLPKDQADLSWENYQGNFVKVGNVYWMEWQSDAEGEKLKQRYREILEDPILKVTVEGEIEKLCGELVNEKVRETLDEKNIVEIKNLIRELRDQHAQIYRGRRHYRFFLERNENPFNGGAINSADNLIEYLEMQKAAYEKQLSK